MYNTHKNFAYNPLTANKNISLQLLLYKIFHGIDFRVSTQHGKMYSTGKFPDSLYSTSQKVYYSPVTMAVQVSESLVLCLSMQKLSFSLLVARQGKPGPLCSGVWINGLYTSSNFHHKQSVLSMHLHMWTCTCVPPTTKHCLHSYQHWRCYYINAHAHTWLRVRVF